MVSRGTACWAGMGLGGIPETGAEGTKDPVEDTSGPVPAWEPPGVGSTRLGDMLHKSEAKSGSTTCPKPGGGVAGKGWAARVPVEPQLTGWDAREPGGWKGSFNTPAHPTRRGHPTRRRAGAQLWGE
jgi:hypothetical protein